MTDTRLQPRWKTEIKQNQVDMAESLTTVIHIILWHLRQYLSDYEYNEIDSTRNSISKVYALLDTICKREDEKLVIKFCDALEKAKHNRWVYLKNYCNSESYDI